MNTGLWDEYGRFVTSQGSFGFDIDADSGTAENVGNGETATWAGGAGIGTIVTATNTITINSQWDYESILGASGAFDVTFATDIPKFDSDVETIIIELGLRSLVAAVNDACLVLLNNATTVTNYHRQTFGANAGAAAVGEANDATLMAIVPANNSPANSFWMGRIIISMVNSTSYLKVMRVHGGGLYDTADVRADSGVSVYKSTGAVTRVQVRTDNHPTDLWATNSFLRIKLIK